MAVDLTNESGDQELLERIIENIRKVYDPEIPVNVYDLGLIYEIHLDDEKKAFVRMTLTTPNCPVAGILPGQVEQAVGNTEGVQDVDLKLTFDPPFTPDMMSDEAKLELGML